MHALLAVVDVDFAVGAFKAVRAATEVSELIFVGSCVGGGDGMVVFTHHHPQFSLIQPGSRKTTFLNAYAVIFAWSRFAFVDLKFAAFAFESVEPK